VATELNRAKINSFGSLVGMENSCKPLAINSSSLLPLARSLKTPIITVIPSSDIFSYSGGKNINIFCWVFSVLFCSNAKWNNGMP